MTKSGMETEKGAVSHLDERKETKSAPLLAGLTDREGEEPFAAFIKGLAVEARLDVDTAKLIIDKYEKERKRT